MSQSVINKKVQELLELEAFMQELKEEADTIRNSIQSVMLERGVEEMEAGTYIIRWTPVLSNRFDTTSFKKIYGDLYKAFTKSVSCKRFSIC